MMRISYKLTKGTTKTIQKTIQIKSEKMKTNNIINFETIQYELTAQGNVIYSILN